MSPSTVRLKSSGSALPPSSLTTVLMIVSCGAISSFTMVQVMSSPSSRVTVPPSTDGHFTSPVISSNT